MIWFTLLVLTLAAAVASCLEGDNCDTNYVTVNTFRTQNSFSVSCYETDLDCDVYFSMPGFGCRTVFLKPIGTVPKNGTKVLTFPFIYGGSFCSKHQIGVYHVDGNLLAAQLPRATEGGTIFHIHIRYDYVEIPYQCGVFGLSLLAKVDLAVDGVKQSFTVDRFAHYEFNFVMSTTSSKVIKVISDNPVIVSCVRAFSNRRLVTFLPISSEPVFTVIDTISYISVLLSDCSTNELITDFSRASLSMADDGDSECNSTPRKDVGVQVFSLVFCTLLVEPLDDQVCVSVTRQATQNFVGDMALPQTRLTTQLVNYPGFGKTQFYSFSLATCTVVANTSSSWPSSLSFSWAEGDLNEKISMTGVIDPLSDVWLIECDKPVVAMWFDNYGKQPFISSFQSADLWQPFFEAECSVLLNVTPAIPSPTKSPSSGTRPLISLMTSWLAIFGISILSLGLEI